MSILNWLAVLPSPIAFLVVVCSFLLLLFMILCVAFSTKASTRIAQVIEALRGERSVERCPHCHSLLKRRGAR